MQEKAGKMKYDEVIKEMKSMRNEENRKGMARFGINIDKALGISLYVLRPMAKKIGKDHELALKLWDSDIHEAMILAALIDEPDKVTKEQMDSWITKFNSWDLCDQVCCSLFDKTPFAYEKAVEWTEREPEFEKRAGFALMAGLAWHDKDAPDSKFIEFFPFIKRAAHDERNFVRKAVNWALRNIGKRNINLNKKAIKVAEEIREMGSKAARWIAADALRELKSDKIKKRLKK